MKKLLLAVCISTFLAPMFMGCSDDKYKCGDTDLMCIMECMSNCETESCARKCSKAVDENWDEDEDWDDEDEDWGDDF